MKYMILSMLLVTLGAGCMHDTMRPRIASIITPPSTRTASSTVDTALCTDPPTENTAGSPIYPIAPSYTHLPHLGQIYTALDCKNRLRLQNIQGMKDGMYVMGVRLHWTGDPSSSTIIDTLLRLGFEKQETKTYQTTRALNIEDLERLKSILEDRAIEEDCIFCG